MIWMGMERNRALGKFFNPNSMISLGREHILQIKEKLTLKLQKREQKTTPKHLPQQLLTGTTVNSTSSAMWSWFPSRISLKWKNIRASRSTHLMKPKPSLMAAITPWNPNNNFIGYAVCQKQKFRITIKFNLFPQKTNMNIISIWDFFSFIYKLILV